MQELSRCWYARVVRLFVIVVAMVIAMARHGLADPAAEQLFRDGKDLMAKGKLAEACDRFARSQKLEPRAGTLLNLGDCEEQLGLTASAWESFMDCRAMATSAGNKRLVAEADRRANALKPKLAYLTITVAPDVAVDGFELRRNGSVIDPAVWNVAVPVDPGDYSVVATAAGYDSWSGSQRIAGGQRATLVVERLAKLSAPAPPITTTTTTATTTVTPPASGPAIIGTLEPAVPRARRWAIGVTMGESSSLDPSFGARLTRQAALPRGALRGIASALYDNFNDDRSNGFMRSDQVLFGGGVEYVWLTQHLAFSAGVSAGLDLLFRNSDRGIAAAPWWGVRASPVIVRLLDGQLEAGLHLQGIQSKDRLAAFGLVALDWYVR